MRRALLCWAFLISGCDWLAEDIPSAPAVVQEAGPVSEAGTTEASTESDGGAEGGDATVEGGGDSGTPSSCDVTFRVFQAQTTGQLAVVGDNATIGSWNTANAVTLAEESAGTWSGKINFAHGTAIQFKFVKKPASGPVEWEDWGANSNRSLTVNCASPTYSGTFNSKPPDAT